MNNKQKKWDKVNLNSSASLWNYTLSPGWSHEEVNVLKNALNIFGIGKWRQIIDSNCLPGKQIGQIYMQTQRLIGQQSLGDFMGLRVDLQKVYLDNMKKQNVMRKNNSVINTGDNPTKEERQRNIEGNRKKYGLSQEEISKLEIPRYKTKLLYQYTSLEELESKKYTTIQIYNNLHFVKGLVQKKIDRVKYEQEQYNPERKVVITLNKIHKNSEEQNDIENNNHNIKSKANQKSKIKGKKSINIENNDNDNQNRTVFDDLENQVLDYNSNEEQNSSEYYEEGEISSQDCQEQSNSYSQQDYQSERQIQLYEHQYYFQNQNIKLPQIQFQDQNQKYQNYLNNQNIQLDQDNKDNIQNDIQNNNNKGDSYTYIEQQQLLKDAKKIQKDQINQGEINQMGQKEDINMNLDEEQLKQQYGLGYKFIKKQGYKIGQGLGKQENGIMSPVKLKIINSFSKVDENQQESEFQNQQEGKKKKRKKKKQKKQMSDEKRMEKLKYKIYRWISQANLHKIEEEIDQLVENEVENYVNCSSKFTNFVHPQKKNRYIMNDEYSQNQDQNDIENSQINIEQNSCEDEELEEKDNQNELNQINEDWGSQELNQDEVQSQFQKKESQISETLNQQDQLNIKNQQIQVDRDQSSLKDIQQNQYQNEIQNHDKAIKQNYQLNSQNQINPMMYYNQNFNQNPYFAQYQNQSYFIPMFYHHQKFFNHQQQQNIPFYHSQNQQAQQKSDKLEKLNLETILKTQNYKQEQYSYDYKPQQQKQLGQNLNTSQIPSIQTPEKRYEKNSQDIDNLDKQLVDSIFKEIDKIDKKSDNQQNQEQNK
ncbi:hypothetical protein PPERSA_06477 [Pseudocohnilembus persalinus]|uniref:G-patch domain-containing protein n=1 Tax=Pseudocohnilembus persalinus TaxID=266149 RepID=A0A0V0QRF4_PSEPJ|nr:hypothetical protein PPERSA_06477 [Pseudocohnilembus persalinus]|eukprot:KRX04843.1 hypothetical protein PPERSA_06477 [Pseudocohnilembus persalinus]